MARAQQQLLFPDPQPLVERLGRDFFRLAPPCPGVYLMRDARDVILYVGKAKNLRKRLSSYRVANPDRLPRRHLRLLSAVVRIELQECPDESAALAKESELLRSLRPRFNRAGTWEPAPRFIAWRRVEQQIELTVLETAQPDWRLRRPRGARAVAWQAALARILWLLVHPDAGVRSLPIGWLDDEVGATTTIHCGPMVETVAETLEQLLVGEPADDICRRVREQQRHAFERSWIEADLALLSPELRQA